LWDHPQQHSHGGYTAISEVRMAHAISPRHHWPGWPSSAAAAYGSRQHRCAAGLIKPVPDQYALATDRQTNEWTIRQTEKTSSSRNPPLRRGGGK